MITVTSSSMLGTFPSLLPLAFQMVINNSNSGGGKQTELILHRRRISKTGKASLLALQNSQLNTKSKCGPSVLRI